MGIYKDILLKAWQEGKIKSEMLPWEPENIHEKNNDSFDHTIPNIFQNPSKFPDDLAKDLIFISKSVFLKSREKKLKIIGITNLSPNLETSLFAANIPFFILQEFDKDLNKSSILLIDTNTKNPTLHRIFSTPNDSGFINILDGKINLNDSIKKLPKLNLDIIPTGMDKGADIDSFDCKKLENVICSIKNNYSFIILNIPYIFETSFSEKLCQFCDGIVIILPKNNVDLDLLAQTKQLLKESNTKILSGIIADQKTFD